MPLDVYPSPLSQLPLHPATTSSISSTISSYSKPRKRVLCDTSDTSSEEGDFHHPRGRYQSRDGVGDGKDDDRNIRNDIFSIMFPSTATINSPVSLIASSISSSPLSSARSTPPSSPPSSRDYDSQSGMRGFSGDENHVYDESLLPWKMQGCPPDQNSFEVTAPCLLTLPPDLTESSDHFKSQYPQRAPQSHTASHLPAQHSQHRPTQQFGPRLDRLIDTGDHIPNVALIRPLNSTNNSHQTSKCTLQPSPPLPRHLHPLSETADFADDDAAMLALLLRRQEQMLNNTLVLPIPPMTALLPETNVTPDPPRAPILSCKTGMAANPIILRIPVPPRKPEKLCSTALKPSQSRKALPSLYLDFQPAGAILFHDEIDSNGTVDISEVAAKGAQERHSAARSRALAFLESLPLAFIKQLHNSEVFLRKKDQSPVRLKRGLSATSSLSSRSSSQSTSHSQTQQPPCQKMTSPNTSSSQYSSGSDDVTSLGVGIQLALLNRSSGKEQVINFPEEPGTISSKSSLLRMTCILRVASVLYDSILTNGMTTKRDIYYRDVALFRHQSVVDKIVDDIVATAGLKRQDFHVCATSKGIIASNALTLHLTTGDVLNLSSTNVTLIPLAHRVARLQAPRGIDWILIVEKDAVMQTLCGARLLEDKRLDMGIIISGKGYPDLSTLQLLRLLADTFPDARIYALVDADPHGLDILSVYTYGSRANKFSIDHSGLGLGERLQWLGVRATEWSSLGRYEDLLELGERDARLALKMIWDRSHMPRDWRRELMQMLQLNRKAEIQILSGSAPGSIDDLSSSLLDLDVSTSFSPVSNRLVEYIVEGIRRGRK